MPGSVIVSGARTPIGRFNGGLASFSGAELGSHAIAAALERSGITGDQVDHVVMGQVLQAGQGQITARQAAVGAGIPMDVPAITINKVCLSGLNAIYLADQMISSGDADVVVAGGMENMSRVPHYFSGRTGSKFGDMKMHDGMLLDGLTDVYNATHMGNCAELCAKEHEISREAQDDFAISSYERAATAWESGAFDEEVVPVSVPQRRGEAIQVTADEEFKAVKMDKIRSLRPAFQKEGTVTAANASTLNDGASALVLVSEDALERLGLKPIAKIVACADAAHQPEWFTTAPAKAVPIALSKAGWNAGSVELWELNEAFSVVGIANMNLLDLNPEAVNVNGGAVALGHPLGSSGSRIVVTLIHALRKRGMSKGGAGICNGGGGASALMVEAL